MMALDCRVKPEFSWNKIFRAKERQFDFCQILEQVMEPLTPEDSRYGTSYYTYKVKWVDGSLSLIPRCEMRFIT